MINKLECFENVKNKFLEIFKGYDVDVEFDSDLNETEDTYSFLVNVTLKPFETDDGKVEPPTVTFEILFDGIESLIIAGEDAALEFNAANVFLHMYFNVICDIQ